MHNEATFNRASLFSVPPDWVALLSWIVFSSYLFLCGGGNIDDKMAPSYPAACASDSHLLTGPSLSVAWFPGEPEVGINSPLPSPSPSSGLSAEFWLFFLKNNKREKQSNWANLYCSVGHCRQREQLNFPVSRGSSWLAVERPAFDL